MLRALSTLFNPKHWGPFVEAAETTGFDHGFTVSWSQGGEDLALLSFLSEIEHGSYIDVGAHHPDRFSVTRHLYQQGWSGINVEANPELIENFNRRRSRDINLNFAVGTRTKYQLTIFDEPAISTVSEEWSEKFKSHNQKIKRLVSVEGVSLLQLLDRYYPLQQIDLLTVDAEGSDFDVLKSLNLENLEASRKPKWILIETPNNLEETLRAEHVVYLTDNGYSIQVVLPMSTLLHLNN